MHHLKYLDGFVKVTKEPGILRSYSIHGPWKRSNANRPHEIIKRHDGCCFSIAGKRPSHANADQHRAGKAVVGVMEFGRNRCLPESDQGPFSVHAQQKRRLKQPP